MEQLFFEMMKLYSGDPKQIQHFTKVHGFARMIGLCEGIDDGTLKTLETAAIVHDIGIVPAMEKYGSGSGKYQELEGPPVAKAMLKALKYPEEIIDRVCYLVGRHHTYKDIDGMDYQILVEADFLVNMFESEMSAKAIQAALDHVFVTKTGKAYCQTMFQPMAD